MGTLTTVLLAAVLKRIEALVISLPLRRWLSVLLALTLIAISLPAMAKNVTERAFEEDVWDADPSEVADVAETLGLVDLRSLDLTRTDLTGNGFAGRGLRVKIPEGGFRGLGPLERFRPAPNQLWYRYHIRLLSWNAAFTGKLPGFAGLYSSSGRGCIPPTEERPGWSARGLFGPPGTAGAPPGEIPIGTYLYHANQAGDCGDALWWPNASLEQGRWHCVEGTVKMNTLGKRNGFLRGWLDGKVVFTKSDIEYRRPGETNIGVSNMWHNIYFGGSWSTPNPLSLIYDQVVVSDSGRIGCLTPFTDIADTVHANALTELHARGLLFGCDYRQACPEGELTRGEAAALFARTLRLPAATRDHFADDQGHVFENAINKMAKARITEGCRTRAFCPDETITRAQFATMVVRAVDITGSPDDYFGDDDGHWAETAINRLASAGLTNGCADDRFCPNDTLTRAQAATFFLRMLNQIEPLGQQGIEPQPDFPPAGDPPPKPPEERD